MALLSETPVSHIARPSDSARGDSSFGSVDIWSSLPTPLFAEIMIHLGSEEYAAVRATCSAWRTSLSAVLQHLAPAGPQPVGWPALFSSVTSVDWSRCICPVSNADLHKAAQLAQLQSLNCSPRITSKDLSSLTDQGLTAIQGLHNLTYLNLSNCKLLTNASMQSLSSMKFATCLRELSISNCRLINDSGLSHLQNLRRLESLSLYGIPQITGEGLQSISSLSLTSLDLRLCKGLGSRIMPLKHMTSLTRLDLTGCDDVTDMAVEHLGQLTRLRNLYLDGCCRLSNVAMLHISHLTNISVLGASMWRHLHDHGLAHIPPGATDLNLSWCSSLRNLDSLPLAVAKSVRVLRLNQTAMAEKALTSMIPKMASLESLVFSGGRAAISRSLVLLAEALGGLPQLTALDVSDTQQLSDDFVRALVKGPVANTLQTIRLMRCPHLTDESLYALASMRNLKTINMVGCSNISVSAILHVESARIELKFMQSQIMT